MKPSRIVSLLLEWFDGNARDLPWRRTQDPYAIWVSEIMLQQTQVKTVVPYWECWMRELPTLRSLAQASPQKIHKLWEGLGYYTRVRNMQKAAKVIVASHCGQFPTNFEEVLELPGIGRYTAGAICSIAFNQPCPVLDGNVIRVLTRLYGIDGDPKDKAANKRLWDSAQELVQQAATQASLLKPVRAGYLQGETFPACSHLNQSLMELGALVCVPRSPDCDRCPLRSSCVARRKGLVEVLPRMAPRVEATQRRFAAFLIQKAGKILVRQRPAGVVNAHLWEFPNIEVSNEEANPVDSCRKELGFSPQSSIHFCTIRHTITRYRIRLDAFQITGSPGKGFRNGEQWLSQRDAQRLAFTSAHKRILQAIKGIDSANNRKSPPDPSETPKLKLSTRPVNGIKRTI